MRALRDACASMHIVSIRRHFLIGTRPCARGFRRILYSLYFNWIDSTQKQFIIPLEINDT